MKEASLSEMEALIYVMVSMSAADGEMTDRELAAIGNLVRHAPIFIGFDEEMLVPLSELCAQKLACEMGVDGVLEEIARSLPKRLHPTAYALAVEVAAADLHADEEELNFLQALRQRLDVDKLSVAAIEYAARVRHRQLHPQNNI